MDTTAHSPSRRHRIMRRVGWPLAALAVLAPAVLTALLDGVHWTLGDHLAAAAILGGSGAVLELTFTRLRSRWVRAAVLTGLAVFLLRFAALFVLGD